MAVVKDKDKVKDKVKNYFKVKRYLKANNNLKAKTKLLKNKAYFFTLALTIITSLSIQGCAKKEPSQTTKSSRGNRAGYSDAANPSFGGKAPYPGVTANAYGKVWGSMTQGGLSSSDFNRSVQMFASASVAPDQIGTVSGMPYNTTGIRFWGSVGTTTKISPATYNYTQVQSTSVFRISIWDSYAGQKDSAGQLIPEYAVYFEGNAYGQVYGNYAEIRFEDSYGSITLRGDISSTSFSGYLSFENTQYWDGAAPGAAGDNVWAFNIPTCSFFNCQ